MATPPTRRDDIDPAIAFFARQCLEDDLFGPDQPLTEQEVGARVAHLQGAEQAEAAELLSGHRSPSQQTFRERVDRVADLRPKAVAAATSGDSLFHAASRWGLGATGLPNWGVLATVHGGLAAEIRAPHGAVALEDLIWKLEPVTLLFDAVSNLLRDYSALASLPWGPDWILRLAQDRPPEVSYRSDWRRPLSVIGGGAVRTVRCQPADPSLPLIVVRRSRSRQETRERLTAAAEHLFYRLYVGEASGLPQHVPDAEALRLDGGFRRWLRRSDAWAGTEAALESALDESHPPGTRPYKREPLLRIRRDVAMWVQVRIWGRSDLDLAGDHADRDADESAFRSHTDGKRPRLPTTAKGVRDAIWRAQRLLERPELSPA